MDVGLVCDACSALTPIGVPQCVRCGEAVPSLDPRARSNSKPPPATKRAMQTEADGFPCPKCAHIVGPDQRFCPSCGTRIPPPDQFDVETRVGPSGASQLGKALGKGPKPVRSTQFFNTAAQSARAKLTLIRGDGEDGVSFTLAGVEHQAGRGDCPISFPDDPFLSPTHANFLYRDSELVIRDEQSLNGIYIRISGTAPLPAGATILVGEQVLVVAPAVIPEDLPDVEGTFYSASMMRPATLEVRQSLRGGQPGWIFRLGSETVSVGREGNDINFPDDPFISGHHAQLRIDAGNLTVTDLGSRNGTFVRVVDEQVLRHGDYVFMGQQLLRVEIV